MIQYIITVVILIMAVGFSIKRIYDIFAKDKYCDCCGESRCGRKKKG